MPKYDVYAKVSGGKYLGCFEAETPEEAEQMAYDAEGCVSLCHQCARECEDAEIESVTIQIVEETADE